MRGYVLLPPLAFSVFLICTFVSAIFYPQWQPNTFTLSDLGRDANHDSQLLFNVGCWISGALLMIGGIWKGIREDGLNRISGILLAIAGVGLFAIGIATGEYPAQHDLATGTLFTCALASIFFATLHDVLNKDRLVLYSSLFIGLLLLIQWPLLLGGTQETVIIFGAAAWSLVQVYKYYKSGELFS